jgi:hypothetical protein
MEQNTSSPSDQRPPGRAKTILPEIPNDMDDEPDDTPSMSGSSIFLPQEPELPPWAQASINPQEIFGPLPTLDISSMLPLSDRRHQSRLSSAQWGVTDQLTRQEVLKYNADMGWTTGNE